MKDVILIILKKEFKVVTDNTWCLWGGEKSFKYGTPQACKFYL